METQQTDIDDLNMENKIQEQPNSENQAYKAIEILDCQIYTNQKGEKFMNEFQLLETIGKGSFSKVKKSIRNYIDSDGSEKQDFYALKIMNKLSLSSQRCLIYENNSCEFRMGNYLEKIYGEINVWQCLHNNNIVRLYAIIDDPDQENIYLVTDYADLGQIMEWDPLLNQYVKSSKIINYILENNVQINKTIDELNLKDMEAIGKYVFKQIANGLMYLHEQNIIHRDIKLDNILFSSKNSGTAYLSDFTIAKQLLSENQKLYDTEGTHGFIAPECTFGIDKGYYGKPTDIWSFGVCLYTFITGLFPFYAESEIEIQINTQKKDPQIPIELSQDCKDLILTCIAKQSEQRLNIKEIVNHPFFSS